LQPHEEPPDNNNDQEESRLFELGWSNPRIGLLTDMWRMNHICLISIISFTKEV